MTREELNKKSNEELYSIQVKTWRIGASDDEYWISQIKEPTDEESRQEAIDIILADVV